MNTLEKFTVVSLIVGSGCIFGNKIIDNEHIRKFVKGFGYGTVLTASTLSPYLIRKSKKDENEDEGGEARRVFYEIKEMLGE